MTRTNLAVCFSPVIFRFYLEKSANLKQTKLDSLSNSYSHKTATTIISNGSTSNDNTPVKCSSSSNVPAFLTTVPSSLEISLPIQATATESNEAKRKFDKPEADTKLVKQMSVEKKHSITESTSSLIQTGSTKTVKIASAASVSVPIGHVTAYQSVVKSNYKRKYSEKINKAASSLVNFGAEFGSSKTSAFFSDSLKDNLETMSKVIQLCVADMIKYSIDLFTVRENFMYTYLIKII